MVTRTLLDRRIVFFAALLGILFGIASVGFSIFEARRGTHAVFSSDIARASEILRDTFTQETYTVRKGDTWSVIAEEADIGGALAARIFDSARDVHDLASVREGNEFRFLYHKKTGVLERIEYDIDKDTFLLLLRDEADKFTAKISKIRYDVQEVFAEGTITSSLFETAQEQDISPNVILNLAHVLSWDVDFASSVQAGDSFAVLYEKRWRDGKPAKPGKILAARFTNRGKDFFAFRYVDPEGTVDYYDEEGRRLQRQFLRSPLDYTRITSGFSYNRFHPILQVFAEHRAIDYGASTGTPVSVTGDGTVTSAGWNGGLGIYIKVRHGGGYDTAYAHLSSIARGVRRGARVKQNQVVGFVGSTGYSTGPHLHYEMHFNGIKINPLSVDLPPGEIMKGEYLEEFYNVRDNLQRRLTPLTS